MDFALNEAQQMLQASARRFLADNHPLTRARQALPWSDAAQQRLWADYLARMTLSGASREPAGPVLIARQ